MPHTIYQAGPLFSEADKAFHRELFAHLRLAGYTVIWPGDLLTDKQIAEAGPHAPSMIFNACREAIDRSTLMVALLDGAQVDDGTAWEIGYAYAKGIPIYGIRTDARRAGETPHSYANSMIQGCLAGYSRSAEGLIRMLGRVIIT
jgi:nucleoside 2-deoxyribosyltransferase